MKRALLWGLVAAALVVGVFVWLGRGGPRIEEGSFLVVDLGGKYVEAVQSPFSAQFFTGAPRPLISLLSEFTKAERDARLAGVVFIWSWDRLLREGVPAIMQSGGFQLSFARERRFGTW